MAPVVSHTNGSSKVGRTEATPPHKARHENFTSCSGRGNTKKRENVAPLHRARHETFMSCPGRGEAKKNGENYCAPTQGTACKIHVVPWAGQSQKAAKRLRPPHRARHEKFMSPWAGQSQKNGKGLHPHPVHGMRNSFRALGVAKPNREGTPPPLHV